MSAIIMRSALVFHGHKPAPDVHSVVIDRRGGERRIVTWDDVMRDRRDRQARIIENKRRVHPWRAYRLWVAYFDQWLMGGWHAFLDDFRGNHFGRWIERSPGPGTASLMRLFPAGLSLGDTDREKWERWKPAFAAQYQRGAQNGKPRGCVFLWWNERDEPRPVNFAGRANRRKGSAHA